eukprot:jgi/Undpi1/2203/HiC_scaffold_12.g05589.m1
MGAFDSVEMGHRCKAWLLQSDVPSAATSVLSRGTNVQGNQWIINAATGDRRREVMRGSAVVLDGGPRWVLSTALGFLTGGVWWTAIYTALFALANYTIYLNSADALWKSDGEAAGVIAYTILATALSMASVPGGCFDSEWRGLASGLIVEIFLCFCVIVSAGIVYNFFGPSLADNSALSPYAFIGRWVAPALIWQAATELRESATQAIKTKLAGLWCTHPMGTDSTSLPIESLWNDWSVDIKECARRVGDYSMLGFSSSDLAILSASSPSPAAQEEIQKLRSVLREDNNTTEPWIRQSAAFLAGYDSRLRILGPESDCAVIPLRATERVIKSLISGVHSEVDSYKNRIRSSAEKANYVVNTEHDDERWFYAGALLADSDQRAGSAALVGTYGSRLAVAVAVLVKGTDPLARLTCYAQNKGSTSSVQLLSSAILSSTKSLVLELADSAGVTIVGDADFLIGSRGLAYATGVPKSLAYSPDELAATSHLNETIVISDDTFSAGSAETIFDSLWGGSENVEKRVDVRDMISQEALVSGSGVSALLGWMCHLGFTLAILTVYLSGNKSGALVVLLLVAIPAKDKRVSVHLDNHYYMIYVSYALNHAPFVNRRLSLSPRGQATIDKAKNLREIVFLFVNILPVLACFIFSGRNWWLAFTPCTLVNLPGLYNTFWCGWKSAFKYVRWSWHLPSRWFSGCGYLEIVELRKRVGRNVLLVNQASNVMVVKQVLPSDVSLPSQISQHFLVVGGRSWPMAATTP